MAPPIQDNYDQRAAQYIQILGSMEYMAPADRNLIAQWRDTTPGPLLDAGCGPGHWTDFLHCGDHHVMGIDLSREFIAHARATYPEPEFLRGDFRDISTASGYFGGILAWYSLIHADLDVVPDILREFARVLRPVGSLLTDFFHGTHGQPFDHAVTPARYWSTEAMEEA